MALQRLSRQVQEQHTRHLHNVINKMQSCTPCQLSKAVISMFPAQEHKQVILQINEICWIISGHGFRVSFQPEQASDLTHCTGIAECQHQREAVA